MTDQNSSSRRGFYCQEMLWQSFSDLAVKRGCSVDTLINEAMSAYLQSNGGVQGAGNGRQPYDMPARAAAPQPISAHQQRQPQAYGRQPVSAYPSANSIPPAPLGAPQGPRVPPPTPASYRRPPSIFEEPVSEQASPGGKPMVLASLSSQPGQAAQQVQPVQSNSAGVIQQPSNYAQMQRQQSYGQPPLYIIFANQKYTVDKDKYIIGRSSQLADLVIRDGNISRKHCAVIFKNGAYYIKDLDSTNGIEFQGQRIDTKRIDEGDQFNICEFHFTFTYR